MIPVEVVGYQDKLDDLFRKIKDLPEDIELRANWAKYLCVLVSGFLEVSLRALLVQYTKKQSSPFIQNYVDSQLKYFQNPKMENILQLLRMFSPQWESEIRQITLGEIKDAVDSIVGNRHKIAHGESVDITFVRISNYYASATKLVDLINNKISV